MEVSYFYEKKKNGSILFLFVVSTTFLICSIFFSNDCRNEVFFKTGKRKCTRLFTWNFTCVTNKMNRFFFPPLTCNNFKDKSPTIMIHMEQNCQIQAFFASWSTLCSIHRTNICYFYWVFSFFFFRGIRIGMHLM